MMRQNAFRGYAYYGRIDSDMSPGLPLIMAKHRASTVARMSCVFCAIVDGEAPAIRVYEDDDYVAILDIRPFTRGHTLVLPKRHTVDLTDTPPETLAGMVTIGQRIARAARATELADATNIGINEGRAAFQAVFHIPPLDRPRRNGDKLSVAKGMVLRRDPDREATGQILREALARI